MAQGEQFQLAEGGFFNLDLRGQYEPVFPVYIVFLIIGIIGYFTIPTVAGWIIQAGGSGSYGRAVTQLAGRGAGIAGGVAGAAAGNVAGRAGRAGVNAGKAAWNHTVGRLIKRK